MGEGDEGEGRKKVCLYTYIYMCIIAEKLGIGNRKEAVRQRQRLFARGYECDEKVGNDADVRRLDEICCNIIER